MRVTKVNGVPPQGALEEKLLPALVVGSPILAGLIEKTGLTAGELVSLLSSLGVSQSTLAVGVVAWVLLRRLRQLREHLQDRENRASDEAR